LVQLDNQVHSPSDQVNSSDLNHPTLPMEVGVDLPDEQATETPVSDALASDQPKTPMPDALASAPARSRSSRGTHLSNNNTVVQNRQTRAGRVVKPPVRLDL
jgi:hypothetical protein